MFIYVRAYRYVYCDIQIYNYDNEVSNDHVGSGAKRSKILNLYVPNMAKRTDIKSSFVYMFYVFKWSVRKYLCVLIKRDDQKYE